MSYHRRPEDSYLDNETEEFDGDNRTDAERLISLIQKASRTPKEDEWVKKLTERMFVATRLPPPIGPQAVAGLGQVAGAYRAIGADAEAVALWVRLSDVATAIGDRDLYYHAMEEIAK